MNLLHCLALVLYLVGAALTAVGTAGKAKRRFLLSFFGGISWAAATVLALVEGASLETVLAITLGMLLLSLAPWRKEPV